jgi:hypothetical protein
MKTKVKPESVGMYHPQTRLQWYAIAFETAAGEPYIIAATTRKGVIRHALSHTNAKNLIIEKINITKGPKK